MSRISGQTDSIDGIYVIDNKSLLLGRPCILDNWIYHPPFTNASKYVNL